MDLRCPKCNSTDLKRISLVYQEGFSRIHTRSRLRAIAVGSDGPDIIFGRATNRGTAQTELSKVLSPPRKRSYRQLLRYWCFALVVGSWVVMALDASMTNTRSAISLPLLAFVAFSLGVLVLLGFSFWRHNHSVFPLEYSRWNKHFVCNRCGEVSEQNLDG